MLTGIVLWDWVLGSIVYTMTCLATKYNDIKGEPVELEDYNNI
jgi:hypothetical protein